MEKLHGGSSWGVHCHEHRNGCVETLTLSRTTAAPPTHEDDYQNLMPALDRSVRSPVIPVRGPWLL